VIGTALVAWIGVAIPAAAQTPVEESRVLVSISTGAAVPVDGAFHDVYTGWSAPLDVQGEFQVDARGLAVVGGVRRIGKSGEARAVSGASPAGISTRFKMTAWRIGAGWSAWQRGWRFAVVGGVSHNAFREEWADAPELTVEDSAFGMFAGMSAARPVWRRLVAALGVELSHVKTPIRDPSLGPVNLGSFDVTFGVGWVF
jgi:hypothetical protein